MSGGDELNDIFGSDDENGENLLGPKIKDKQKSKTVSSSSFYINEIPKLNPSGYSLTLRLPNFLKIATSAYDSSNLEREEVETKIYQEATSVIRWRFSENNELESNARLVKFKNGEYQLIVGGEVFEGKIVQAPLRFAFMKQTNNPPAKQTSEFSDQIEMVNENTPDSCLECIGEVNRKININPSSVDSEAHARIAMNSTMKHRKASRMKSLDKDHMAVNPEKEKEARKIAHSDEMKRERRLKESSGGGGEAPRRYLSASFLEEGLEQQEYDEEDDGGRYDSYNIKNLKRKSTSSSSYKRSSNIKSNSSSKPVKKSRPSFITNAEDVEEEEEEEDEEDEEDLDEYEDDEEEEEEAEEVVTKKKKKQEEVEEEEEEEEDVRITEEIITPKRPKVSAEPPPRTSQNNTTVASTSQETSSSTISATESAAAAVTASDSTKTNPTATVITTTTAAKKRTSRVIVDSDED